MSSSPASQTLKPKKIEADSKVDIKFSELELDERILKALGDIGYETPTPIQAHAIPPAMRGQDVLGIAQTGTGKTGAFTLPIMHLLAKGRARARMPRCIIICPTRELAAQVAENVENYGKYLKLEMALLIGGVSFAKQDAKLSKGVDILIATPGRLLDQFERGKILMTGVKTLVVDEADRMMDMGFIPDIEKIFKLTPFTRQVLFFSATMPDEIKSLVDRFLHQPVSVQVSRQSKTADTVTQRIVKMPSGDAKQKRTALRWVIDNHNVTNGIVFCNRKRDVDIVAKSLAVHGHSAAPIHGDLAQNVRMETLDNFRSGELKLLVASDVAARGLDIPNVSHVLNYDVPTHSEDYVHRIGRTGRAGRKGDTVMFVTDNDDKYYKAILKLIQLKSIEAIEIEGIEDFPTEGRRSRGRERSDGRRRGGRNRDRHNKDRDNRERHNNRSENRSRKSSKTRNKADDDTQTMDDNDVTSKSSKPSRSKSSNTSKKSKSTKAKQDEKTSQNTSRKKDSRHSKKRGRNELDENTVSGFGENAPAFFKKSF